MPAEPARARRRGGPRAAGGRSPGRPGSGRRRAPAGTGAAAPAGRTDSPRTATDGPTVGEEIRLGRAQRMAAATSGILGVSSTRRAAVLALVVCALALSVAVPLRNYLGQRQELSRMQAEQRRLSAQVERLDQERDRLRDPDEIAREARSRLGYVRPGEIPFVVQLPDDPSTARPVVDLAEGQPWYDTLWRDLKGVPR